MNLFAFLIAVLIALVVLYCLKLLIDWMELPQPVRKVVLLIVGLILLLFVLSQLGVMGPRVLIL